MKKLSLRVLTACSLGVVVLTTVGCGSTEVSAGSSGMFAPQTGSMLGRRLPPQQLHETRQRSARTTKAEKSKRQKVKKEPKRERADEDYMTRGGFR